MNQSLLSAVIDHIFGRKYYMVILKRSPWPAVNPPCELCSYIFLSKDLALDYIHQSVYGRAAGNYSLVCIKSFRCRTQLVSSYNPNRHLDFSKFN